MDSENSKISDTYRQLLNLLEKMNLKRRNKYVALSNYTWKNIRKWSKSISFDMEWRVRIAWYYLELLTPETMKLLASTKSKITKNENGESVFRLEITETVLIYCKLLTTIISKIKEYGIHLFLVSHLVNH